MVLPYWRIKDYPDRGGMFKLLFVLYAGSIILIPLPEHKIKYNLFPILEDVNSIAIID